MTPASFAGVSVLPSLRAVGVLDSMEFFRHNVLSSDGAYEASSEEQKLVCLISDGRLLVANGQALNSHVQSYQARLTRMRRPFQVVFTDIEVIDRAYRAGKFEQASRHQGHTMMQVTAKDLLAKACRARASDIHIRVNKVSTEFYFRIHNDLIKIGEQTQEYGERLLATLYSAMTSVSDNTYKPTERQDASISDRDKLPDTLFGVRVATAPTSDGHVMVLRLLYNDAGEEIDLSLLGFSPVQAAIIQTLKDQPIGLNIIGGPTGSGKSTTLQRILAGEILEAEGKMHVLTVEDPVEYPIPGAVQTAVTNAGTEAERSRLFSAAIANAMRLDPDTIMIGEIRDLASAQSALRAAMTGHQVWTTVHANSAMAILDRLVDLGLPVSMIVDHDIVSGLISQRLVKVLCPSCKKPAHEHESLLSSGLLRRLKNIAGANFHQVCIAGTGCEHCDLRGAIGRTVVAEVIHPDARICDFIRAGEKTRAIHYWRTQLGGRTLVEHAIEKVLAGLVDPREAEKSVGHLISVELKAASMAGMPEAEHEI